ncbi:unnamed protein product [Pleuronectes platessa]|uniref:Uncharacterized protein n=1 Tax=Pleuronectes platessa TaxID=8262 RepID=A0A9N7VNB4_PLEPL|nr:unnamed protein product [Pleuronectes platessa]
MSSLSRLELLERLGALQGPPFPDQYVQEQLIHAAVTLLNHRVSSSFRHGSQPLVSEHHRIELEARVVFPPVASNRLLLRLFRRLRAGGVLWGSGCGEPCLQVCLVACLVNLGTVHKRLEAKQKPGCGRPGEPHVTVSMAADGHSDGSAVGWIV